MSNVCEICEKVFSNGRIKSNHIRWKHRNNDKYLYKLSKISVKREEKKHGGKFKNFEVICANPECKKEFKIKEREFLFPKKEKYFCGRSCANRRIHSEETKIKIGKAVSINNKRLWQDENYVRKMMLNGNGKKKFTSKGEREVRKYFISKYPNDGWTFGGHLIQDGIGLTRDLYSKKLKICIEYNGIWHYKDIHDQLKEKQLKDKKLKKWCRINGYKLMIVRDDDYRKNKEKVLQLLEKKINENIIIRR